MQIEELLFCIIRRQLLLLVYIYHHHHMLITYDRGGSVVDAREECGAEGASDGVCAGEDDHLLVGEVLGREAGHQLGRVERRRGEVGVGVGEEGDVAVAAARGHLVREVAREVDAVARRERHDVRARHRLRAALLHRRLGRVDHLEPAEARVVGRRVALRRVVRGGQQHRRVTALILYIIGHHQHPGAVCKIKITQVE